MGSSVECGFFSGVWVQHGFTELVSINKFHRVIKYFLWMKNYFLKNDFLPNLEI